MDDLPDLPRIKKKWVLFRKWKKFLDTIPNQPPSVQLTVRPKGMSGVFFLTSSVIDYDEISSRILPEGNKTIRRNFGRYLTHLYSPLIEKCVLPDGTVKIDPDGVQLYSLWLKKINRNASQFNDVLIENGLLDVESLHNNDPKKGKVKCRSYNLPPEILSKGIKRTFFSPKEKRELIRTVPINRKPDKTDTQNDPVLKHIEGILRRTTFDQTAFEDLEIEAGQFCQIVRSVGRFNQGKFDLFRNETDHRVYSGYVYAPKRFRGLLRLDGKFPFVEGDVSCCHFHFLLRKMTDPEEREKMKRDLVSSDPYLTMCGNPVGVSREELKQNSHKFKNGNRVLNEYGMTDLERSNSIEYTDQVFYRHFSKGYPIFAKSMSSEYVVCKKHRRDFACDTMQREAKVMIDQVGERCRSENLIYLPIHDGFLTLPEQFDRICQIVTECFQKETGSTPKIKRK